LNDPELHVQVRCFFIDLRGNVQYLSFT